MMQIIRQNWFYISLATLVASFGYLIYKEKNTSEKPKVIYIHHTPKPKTDSVFAVIDSVLKQKKEVESHKEEIYRKKESILKRQLQIERSKKLQQPKPKTKIIVETKEVIVEKVVKVDDPNTREILRENYKTQQENYKLREELECIKRQKFTERDSITTDTIRKKKRKFLFF